MMEIRQDGAPPLKICYFPGRETNYARNRVLLKGMREAGLVVYDCSYPKRNFLRYVAGFVKFLCFKARCDIIFVGFLGQFLVPLVKLFTKKVVVFDALISIYQTLAFDRRAIPPSGLLARLARFADRFSCQLADKVFLDTQQHIDYFVAQFRLDKNKFSRIFVGSEDSVMHPRQRSDSSDFIVHFHGEFQSLHGTEHIMEAARLLPDIKFQLIGKGSALKKCVEMAKHYNLNNVTFIPPIPYEQLPEYMAKASVCLGIFGETQKAQLVIPHKVYEALAMAKPLITADTPAARELLTHKMNAFLCEAANPRRLAEAILELKGNPSLCSQIAENGYKLFQEKCSPLRIGRQISEIVSGALAD